MADAAEIAAREPVPVPIRSEKLIVTRPDTLHLTRTNLMTGTIIQLVLPLIEVIEDKKRKEKGRKQKRKEKLRKGLKDDCDRLLTSFRFK